MQPSQRKQLDPKRKWARLRQGAEKLKASVRAKVEHALHVLKNLFRHKKARYNGWGRTRDSCSACSGWPIWSSPRGRRWRSMPEVGLERGRRP